MPLMGQQALCSLYPLKNEAERELFFSDIVSHDIKKEREGGRERGRETERWGNIGD